MYLGRRTLVRELDLPALAGGLHQGEAHLEGGHTPAPVVRDRRPPRERRVQLPQLDLAGCPAAAHRDLVVAVVVVDEHAVRRLAQVAALAAHHEDTEPVPTAREPGTVRAGVIPAAARRLPKLLLRRGVVGLPGAER